MARNKKQGFTLVEMLVASSIFAVIFGLCGMLYVQSTWRAANALELNKLEGQVRDLDRFIEQTIQNSDTCSVIARTGSGLDCLMPTTGSGYDQFGFYNVYTPSSCSSGTVHWGVGKYRFIYFSDSTLKYMNTGSYLSCVETASAVPGVAATGNTLFTYIGGNTNIYTWPLVDSVTYTINSNNSVTYTIHATDLTRTGAALGSSTDYANSHTLQLTRTVYWRHAV